MKIVTPREAPQKMGPIVLAVIPQGGPPMTDIAKDT